MTKGRSGRKMVVLSVALVGILGLGAGVAMGPRLLKTEEKAKTESAPAKTGKASSEKPVDKSPEAAQVVVPLGEFLVNLDDEPQVRYLRAELAVQMARPQEKKRSGGHGHGGGEAKAELPGSDLAVARDRVVTVLSAAGFGELRTVPGRDKLKARLLARLQEALPQHDISEVLVTSFVMQ